MKLVQIDEVELANMSHNEVKMSISSSVIDVRSLALKDTICNYNCISIAKHCGNNLPNY